MPATVACSQCSLNVTIPNDCGTRFNCPACGALVWTIDPNTGVSWRSAAKMDARKQEAAVSSFPQVLWRPRNANPSNAKKGLIAEGEEYRPPTSPPLAGELPFVPPAPHQVEEETAPVKEEANAEISREAVSPKASQANKAADTSTNDAAVIGFVCICIALFFVVLLVIGLSLAPQRVQPTTPAAVLPSPTAAEKAAADKTEAEQAAIAALPQTKNQTERPKVKNEQPTGAHAEMEPINWQG